MTETTRKLISGELLPTPISRAETERRLRLQVSALQEFAMQAAEEKRPGFGLMLEGLLRKLERF